MILFRRVDEHGKILFDALKAERGSDKTHFIHGGVKGDIRKDIRYQIENGSGHILVASLGTSSVGLNIKNLHNLILASPIKGQIAILQSIGRGLRKGDTKEKINVFDVVDQIEVGSYKCYSLAHGINRIKIYTKANLPFNIQTINI